MKTRLENLIVQHKSSDSYCDFHYYGNEAPLDENKAINKRLSYHFKKYCKLIKKNLEYDKYSDTFKSSSCIILTLPLGTVKKLTEIGVPSELAKIKELSERLDKFAEMTDYELLDLLYEINSFGDESGIITVDQIPNNLMDDLPGSINIRFEKIRSSSIWNNWLDSRGF